MLMFNSNVSLICGKTKILHKTNAVRSHKERDRPAQGKFREDRLIQAEKCFFFCLCEMAVGCKLAIFLI